MPGGLARFEPIFFFSAANLDEEHALTGCLLDFSNRHMKRRPVLVTTF